MDVNGCDFCHADMTGGYGFERSKGLPVQWHGYLGSPPVILLTSHPLSANCTCDHTFLFLMATPAVTQRVMQVKIA